MSVAAAVIIIISTVPGCPQITTVYNFYVVTSKGKIVRWLELWGREPRQPTTSIHFLGSPAVGQDRQLYL